MTLRNTTERPETVTMGTNELIGTDPAAIAPWMRRLFAGKWKTGSVPPLWDGQAGKRIAETLLSLPDRALLGRPGASLRPSPPPL